MSRAALLAAATAPHDAAEHVCARHVTAVD